MTGYNEPKVIAEIIKRIKDPIILFTISFGLILVSIGVYSNETITSLKFPLLIVYALGLGGTILLKRTSNENENVISCEIGSGSFFRKTYPRSQHPDFFNEVESLVPKAKNIILIATGLNLVWEKHIVDMLISRSKSGEAKVTICLGNPFSPHVEDRLIEEEMRGNRPPVGRDGIERNIKNLVQSMRAAGSPENFSVCLFEHYPTFATLIFDQDIFIYPYAYIVLGNNSSIFHLCNNGSEESKFFISNAERILKDSVPAEQIYESRRSKKYISDNWLLAAVYLIPDANDPVYQFGSTFLGYDVHNNKEVQNQIEFGVKSTFDL